MQPKESREDRLARKRERRLSEIERTESAQEQAAGLTTELRSIYGLRGPMMASPTPRGFKPGRMTP